MLKAIVFDFDGVIADSEPLHYRAFVRVARGMGIDFSYGEYLERYIGYDDRDAFRVMLGMAAGVEGDAGERARVGELVATKAEAFEAVVAAGIEPIAGAPELVRAAAAAMPVAIASGATRRDIDLILGALGLRAHFEVIVTADMVTRSKPDPESYALAARGLSAKAPDLGIEAAECLAIEDTAAGIESARGAGLMTLGLASTGPRSKLHRAHRAIDSLEGVTVPRLRAWFDGGGPGA